MIPIKDRNPTLHFPVVTVGILVVNVAVWLLYQVPDLDRSVVEAGYYPCQAAANPCVIPDLAPTGPPWPLDAVTSMFMHGSWIHIAGNMLFLWVFGNNVEDRLGRLRFLVFYLACGFAATAAQTAVTLAFGSDLEASIPNVGASGAIAGVLGAYMLLFPRARVLTLFLIVLITVFEIPAVWFLGAWFLFQAWQGGFDLLAPSGDAGGVAFFAHIGGFAFLVTGMRSRPPQARVPGWPRGEL